MGHHRKPVVVTPARAISLGALAVTGAALVQDVRAPDVLQEELPSELVQVAFPSFISVAPDPVPATAPAKSYTVVTGDTLSKIAARFGQSVGDLAGRNRAAVADPDVILVGQVLSLDAPVQPAPRPRPAPQPRARTAAPPPAPRAAAVPQSAQRVLAAIEKCESGGRNVPNSSGASTASGFYQITNGTWASVGGKGRAMNAPRAEQTERAAKLLATRGTQPWDASRHCWGDEISPVRAGAVRLTATSGEAGPEVRAADAPATARGVSAIPSIAKTFTGVKYVYGGKNRATGLDCSGFVFNVLKQAGLSNTYRTSGALREWATPISKSQARAGDLVFGPGHVGIYLGDGMMIDAPRPGKTIQVRQVYSTMTSYGRIPA